MKAHCLLAGLLALPGVAGAQYPSPTMQDLTVRGTLTLNGPLAGVGVATLGTVRAGDQTAAGVSLFAGSQMIVANKTGINSIIGIADNSTPAGTLAFPTGTTGYGRLNSTGGVAFGLFGRADLYSTGTATNEVNSFNFSTAPSGTLPPNRAFGTTDHLPIALTVAAGGTARSAIGIHLVPEGSIPNSFLTGYYSDPAAATQFGMVLDATATVGPTLPLLVKGTGAGIVATLQAMGTYTPANAMLTVNNAAGSVMSAIKQDGSLAITGGFALAKDTLSHPGFASFAAGGSGMNFGTANGVQVQVTDGGGGTNQLQLHGAAASSGVGANAIGSDANIDIVFAPKGTGSVKAGANVVWHAGNLTPANYAPLASPSFTGTVATAGPVNVTDASNANATIALTNTGSNGANIRLAGNGGTTPNKSLRALGGQFQIINSAYSAVILTLDDAGNLTIPGTLSTTGVATFAAAVKLAQATVAALPTCNAGLKGALYGVTDATAPSYNGTLTGGGAVAIPAYCNGSAWTAH